MNTRRNVSCDGMPCFSVRKLFSHPSLLWAYSTLGIQRTIFPTLCASNHATDGHDENLEQVVLHFGGAAGIVYLSKCIDEVVEQGEHFDPYGMVPLQ